MADENELNPDMDEYKLSEESNVAPEEKYEETPLVEPVSPSAAKVSRAKRLFIPIILIVVIIIVYQLLNWYSNRRAQSSLNQEEVVAQKSVQGMAAQPAPPAPVAKAPVPAVVTQPLPSPPPPQPIIKKENVTMEASGAGTSDITTLQKLDILAVRTESNTEQIENFKDAMVQNQTGLTNLNQTVDALSTKVKELNDSVQQLIVSQAKAKQPKKVKRGVSPSVLYHIKAIVPGLAWLESSNGKTIAVRVGQRLSGYGTVRLISPKDGMVVTSSGAVIQYGVNDF